MNPINIFIPAAGLGERLRPITNHIPKPLIPILGKPVLQIVLEKVSVLPANKIGINLHHKKEFIANWIKQSDFSKKVELFPENTILGTGGALKNAEAFLKNSTFLIHNSDIISDIDLEQLITFHLSGKNLVTLAVHNYPEFNKLAIDKKGFLKGIGNAHDMPSVAAKWVAFTGIAVYHSEFLKFLPLGVSSVVDAWLKVMREGYKIGTLDVSGCYWSDIGTPASYAKAIIDELGKNGEMVYIHPSVKRCKYIEMDGYVVIEEESVTNKGVSIRNCIMLPGSHTKSDSHYESCILGPGFKIDLSKSEVLGFSRDVDALHIGTGGSDRKYFRVKRDNHSAVLMQSPDGDPDFQRHIEYTRFFKRTCVPVPQLIDVDSDKMSAFFEDLGDISLYSWLKCPRHEEQIERMYEEVLDILVIVHTAATKHVSECMYLTDRIFDYEHLRWETGYFMERFVEGVRNIKVNNLLTLNDEFHRLALKVDSFRKTVIHRDFQSQNIMITRGTPRLVDYQGARIGPPAYDLASILWDPYYPIDDDSRERLLNYYINEVSKICSGKHLMKTNPPSPPLLKKGGKGGLLDNRDILFNETDFELTLLPCRLQRHMQALGAYGFLSKIKGKKYFMKYVPEGLRLLKEDLILSKDEYPKLYDLTMRL
jgi:NDP-sugar pyrophosphorylase family protein/aminoglycoside/choline kinase family phosphotransferase